jgi:hypothetical protein
MGTRGVGYLRGGRAEAPAYSRDGNGLALADSTHLLDRFHGDTRGTGEDRGGLVGHLRRHADERGDRYAYQLGEAAIDYVTEQGRKKRDAGSEPALRHPRSQRLNRSISFVTEDQGKADAPSEDARHDERVMVADAGSANADDHVTFQRLR